MSADFTPEKEDYKILTPFKMQVLTNFPYIEADFDALTNYQLLCKVVEYLNNVIHNENEVTEQITSLYNAYIELQNYVNNYFNNLDVQEEINNKLDEMVEDGTLDQIIEQYLNSSAIWGFNTVADMKNATNLIDGSFAKTLGYYSINDGGASFYKIVEDLPVDEYYETLNNGLYAILIVTDSINVKQFGAIGDGTTDDSTHLTTCFNYGISKHKKVKLLSEIYFVAHPIDLQYPRDLTIEGTNNGFTGSSIIKSNTICLKWCGAKKCNINGVYFIGEIGIQFYERDIHSQDSRTYNCEIKNCIFNCTTSGVDIESLNGYMYIKHNTFRVKNRGIGLGINFTNLTGVTAPNYFYIEENNFLTHNDVTTEITKAIDVYYATYVFINKNDFAIKYGIDFSNMTGVCSNFRIENNSFFENIYAIKADTNTKVLKELLAIGNTFRLNDTSYGIDVTNSNNQLFNFTGNYFEVSGTNVTPLAIIKFNASTTYQHIFNGNTAPLLSNEYVHNLCQFPSQIIRQIQNYYSQHISLNAGASNTVTLGNKYSWIKNRFADCTNPNISITTTANDDGSITIAASNSTESTQRGMLITSY